MSTPAMFWRLRNLDWLSDSDRVDIVWDRLTWHGQEPETEAKPRLFCQDFVNLLFRVLDDGLVSAMKAAELLNCSIEDIEGLFAEYEMETPFEL